MEFDLQPNLNNDLVILRPLAAEDFDALFTVAADPKIWEQHPDKNRCTLAGFTNFFEDSLASKGCLIIIDKESSEVIGSSRFKIRSNFKDAVEIGWTFLSRKYWGGHYNGVIKWLMMEYAFQHINRILFFVAKDNLRSQKAVEKLTSINGFQLSMDKNVVAEEENITYIIKKSKIGQES
ncbi:GNAT family N-acetyltransferase [Flagellimonas sp. S3867]|uniref:GNAT family N-acetyltransferase n=1 Tax=Flagellimonas sp. S3867 TaxID=2768063 RepID=UPI001688F3E9|nr:GNAT family N-acetyltransferase [Flagellimonas sp. S3867]